jgi:hypothetical protein
MRIWTILVIGAAALIPGFVIDAAAATITFETAPFGFGFTGPVTENGFTYSTLSGNLVVENFGNPGQDMEGDVSLGGGALDIVAAVGGGTFTFSSLDFSAETTRARRRKLSP